MNRQEQKLKEEKYLRASYIYYYCPEVDFGDGRMLDSDFDLLQKELKENSSSRVPDFVEFPTMDELKELNVDLTKILDGELRDETKYPHLTKMLSLEKFQVNNEEDFSAPVKGFTNFSNRINFKGQFEATAKYDGNGMECLYYYGKLVKALTRGKDKTHGLDKTEKVRHLVPNEIDLKDGIYEVRGEIVVDVELWEKKYKNPDKVQNPRNYVAGVLNRDEYSIDTIKDLVFIAYSLVKIEGLENKDANDLEFKEGKKVYVENSQSLLADLGFNDKYNPLVVNFDFNGEEDFKDVFYKYKQYRDSICPFLLDGIVIKYPEPYRTKLGENNHHPKWASAIKFVPTEVSTTVIDIVWSQGKDYEFTPVAILEPTELDGVVVRRASLHNIGYIIFNHLFIGSQVVIAKKGEIIPQIVGVISSSPDAEKYMEQYENFNSIF